MASNQNQNSSTITGDVKSRIDKIWDTLWAGGMCLPASMPSKHSFAAKQQEFKTKYL